MHAHSRIDPEILSSILDKPDERPVFAQLIGENLSDLRRVARELKSLPIAGVDLNLGCPAPRVYHKNVGGGLLRDPEKIRQILEVLGEESSSLLSVKMRIGFEDDRFFETILEIIAESSVGLVSIHARTVRGGYQSEPSYRHVAKAVGILPLSGSSKGSVETAGHALSLGGNGGSWNHDRSVGDSEPLGFQERSVKCSLVVRSFASPGGLVRLRRRPLPEFGQTGHRKPVWWPE